ncbi:MAG: VWA domain-containing protein [Chlamydiia bacterium]|nr:VWA domain-containing protein [Chlamydiia bacterium]
MSLRLNKFFVKQVSPKKNRKILSVCIALSLSAHIASLLVLQTHGLFYTPPQRTAQETPIVLVKDPSELSCYLKEALAQEHFKEKAPFFTIPLAEPVDFTLTMQPHIHIQPIDTTVQWQPSFLAATLFPNRPLEGSIQQISFSMPAKSLPNLFEHLPKDLIVPSASPGIALPLLPSPLPKTLLSASDVASPSLPETAPLAKISYSNPLLASLAQATLPPKLPHFSSLPHLPDLPTLEDLETASYSDCFDTEVVFTPLEGESRYLFALTLVQRPGLNLPKIGQQYSFLLDHSNSIQKERLAAVKNSILKSLEELDIDDSFNLIAFDNRIEKLAPAPLPVSSSSIDAAKNFLNQIHLGSFFSTATFYKPLLLTMPTPAQDDLLHTAILFTDGEALNKKMEQRNLALEWTVYNRGRVVLYAVGMGGDPHLATLDASAAFNRGKIIYSTTKRGTRRKILKLMKTISHPIAKNLSAHAVCLSPLANICLYPKATMMPPLYLNEPYVILGTTDSLDNFVLFIQGKIKGKWLNIKKTISFANAKKGDASLQAQWALQCAYELYAHYLCDSNPSHLEKAGRLLQPHNLQVAFH